MGNSYKLSQEIEQFIISQKNSNPLLSCRSLIPLIKEKFQVSISKSLINRVIKESNLSAPRGRKRLKEPEFASKPILEPMRPTIEPVVYGEPKIVENGGFFFLRAADLRLSLTASLAQGLTELFPETTQKSLQAIVEASMYLSYFQKKDSTNLWLLIGKEIALSELERYSQKLAQIPIQDLKNALSKANFLLNFNEIKELYKQWLLKLSLYAQEVFFPTEYKSLGFEEMQERFYSMLARIEKRPRVLKISLLYPPSFSWANDNVWQEGFGYAAYKVNQAAIFTKEGEQIWMSSLPELLI